MAVLGALRVGELETVVQAVGCVRGALLRDGAILTGFLQVLLRLRTLPDLPTVCVRAGRLCQASVLP